MLDSDLMGKGVEDAPALPLRRRTPDRITGRTAAPSVVTEAAAPPPASPPTAGGVFYDKGAATAANFRPSYWSYDQAAPAETPVPAAPADEARRIVEVAPEPAPTPLDHAAAADRDEPPAVVGAPLDSASVADELAATIEHVLGSRYAGARSAPESAPPPRRLGSAVTADSLMAELAAARQSRSSDDNAGPLSQSSRAPKKAASLLDRLFAVGGIALVLFALLALSPWRDSLPLPSITHFFG